MAGQLRTTGLLICMYSVLLSFPCVIGCNNVSMIADALSYTCTCTYINTVKVLTTVPPDLVDVLVCSRIHTMYSTLVFLSACFTNNWFL